MKRYVLALALVLAGCTPIPGSYTPPAPSASPAPTSQATDTPTPTSTATLTPTPTVTATVTPTPTIDWSATPTPIGNSTAAPWIIEATAIGGEWWATPIPKIEDLAGTYTPHALQNVRWCPAIDCSRRYQLSAGQTVAVVAWVSDLPYEAWLCLSEACDEAIALVYGSVEYGMLILSD